MGEIAETTQPHGSVFWMGLDTYKIPMTMYADNRKRFVERMKSAGVNSGVLILEGGMSATRYDTDTDILFRQESYFAYLFGVTEPDFYGGIDISSGKSVLFTPRLPPSYAIWSGNIKEPQEFKAKYEVDVVLYSDEVPVFIRDSFSSASANATPIVFLLQGPNSDSGNTTKPASFEGRDTFTCDLEVAHAILSECRVVKSAAELEVLRYVNRVSSAGHVEVMRSAHPGMKEYQMEAAFQHYVYSKGGCRNCSYTCICATGANSAVLHYGHAGAPNDKTVGEGDMGLLDMGAEYNCYCSDITCTFPVNGKFTVDQKVVYLAVLRAQQAVMSSMAPGVSWLDMHILAGKTILEHLKQGGFLRGSVDDMMTAGLAYVFMPHGLGHFLGLDTHDVGGYPQGVQRSNVLGLSNLRTARSLEEGMVITVEPGCYFIETLLAPAITAPATAAFFVKDSIERLRGSGGVRIEDDVIVTGKGCENMTKCPREIEEIEAVMAGGVWVIEGHHV